MSTQTTTPQSEEPMKLGAIYRDPDDGTLYIPVQEADERDSQDDVRVLRFDGGIGYADYRKLDCEEVAPNLNEYMAAAHATIEGLRREKSELEASLPWSTNRTRNTAAELLGEVLRHQDGENGASHGCVEVNRALLAVDALIGDCNAYRTQLEGLRREVEEWKRDAEAYKSQLRLAEEHAGTMARDFDQSITVSVAERTAIKEVLHLQGLSYEPNLAESVEAHLTALRTQLEGLTKERDEAKASQEEAVAKAFREGQGAQAILESRARGKFIEEKKAELTKERNELRAELVTLRAANDALTKAADELRSELAKNVLQEDSYGVPESSFYICPYCHHESGAGVLNKGITHAEDCILSGNYDIAMARIGTLAETQDKLATAEAEIEHLTAILAERDKELAEVRAMLETDRVHAAAVQEQIRAQLDRADARVKELEGQRLLEIGGGGVVMPEEYWQITPHISPSVDSCVIPVRESPDGKKALDFAIEVLTHLWDKQAYNPDTKIAVTVERITMHPEDVIPAEDL